MLSIIPNTLKLSIIGYYLFFKIFGLPIQTSVIICCIIQMIDIFVPYISIHAMLKRYKSNIKQIDDDKSAYIDSHGNVQHAASYQNTEFLKLINVVNKLLVDNDKKLCVKSCRVVRNANSSSKFNAYNAAQSNYAFNSSLYNSANKPSEELGLEHGDLY